MKNLLVILAFVLGTSVMAEETKGSAPAVAAPVQNSASATATANVAKVETKTAVKAKKKEAKSLTAKKGKKHQGTQSVKNQK